MKIGAVMFFTADSMQPAALGRALEDRGFESLWVPEHTHVPLARSVGVSRRGRPAPAVLRLYDPFLALNAAATATTTLKIGTGICLVVQRDPIVTAKMVSTIDQLSQRPLPVRRRQRLEPRRDREPRHRVRHPQQTGARTDRGDAGDLDQRRTVLRWRIRQIRTDEPMAETVPDAVPADHRRRRLPARRAPRHPLRQRLDSPRRSAGA